MLTFAVSCSNNLDIETQPDTISSTEQTKTAGINDVTVVDGMLNFKNQEHIDSTVVTLLNMSTEEQQAWYKSVGFISLEELYNTVNEQINNITSYEQYTAIRTKYGASFLFNTKDKEDLPPYFKIKRDLFACVVNANGQAMVGGQVQNFNDIETVEQTQRYISQNSATGVGTRATNATTNHLYCTDGRRKLWLDASRVEASIFIRVGCQVKSGWGWNRFRQTYWFKPSSSYDYSRWDVNSEQFTANVWKQSGVVNDGHSFLMGKSRVAPMTSQGYMTVEHHYEIYANDMGIGQLQNFYVAL